MQQSGGSDVETSLLNGKRIWQCVVPRTSKIRDIPNLHDIMKELFKVCTVQRRSAETEIERDRIIRDKKF